MDDKADIISMNPPELAQFLAEMGCPGYRAGQVFMWLHQKNAAAFSQMTNLPQALREKLSDAAVIKGLKQAEKQVSRADKTVKYLFKTEGGSIETVVISAGYGNTVCVSSQVGCAFGCTFCASGKNGLVRSLTAGEMLQQVYLPEKDLNIKISNAVIMGIGEPLSNFNNLLRFLEIINFEEGRRMSMRNITVSTCGLVPEIYKLAEMKTGVGLAISLHTADDKLRKRLMPRAAKYSIRELTDAADAYLTITGRRVSWEYMLIKGVNDSRADAHSLAALLKNKNTHINIIVYNDIQVDGFAPSRAGAAFAAALKERGINATCRRSAGYDIKAACGQLRNKQKVIV